MLKIKRLDNVGMSHLLVPVLAISLIAAAGAYMVFRSKASVDPKFDINKVSVQLGPEEYVAGPTNAQDATYINFKDDRGRMYGLTANSSSYVFPLEEDTLLPTNPVAHNKDDIPKHQVILEPDTAVSRVGEFAKHPDACGAWMLSIQKDTDKKNPDHWYGWYHSEHNCPRGDLRAGERTHMELAYAESFDKGKTWVKGKEGTAWAYPNNRIITADVALKDDRALDDTGNSRYIKVGDYYYVFYQSAFAQEKDQDGKISTNRRMTVARSKVSSLGKPGTWYKWYCTDPKVRSTCDFTQPGIGGKSSMLRNSDTMAGVDTAGKAWKNQYVLKDRYMSYNRYLNRYIAMSNEDGGFKLLASEGDDILNWKSKDTLIMPMPSTPEDWSVNNWDQSKDEPALCTAPPSKEAESGQGGDSEQEGADPQGRKRAVCKQMYGYNSIIGIKGAADQSGQTFYMYYNKHFPGQGFDDGYIIRRKVTLIASDTSDKTTRTELSLYEDKNGNQRITSELPEPWLKYTRKARVGYVLSAPAAGYEPLFECKKPNGTYYTMRLKDGKEYDMPVTGDPPTWCDKGQKDKLVRRVGWVAPHKIDGVATEPIYDVSTTEGKDSKAKRKTSSAIGWALPALPRAPKE